jgi:4-amino-4-deoxy-L-arabinose transferase-like glycosyltransferase
VTASQNALPAIQSTSLVREPADRAWWVLPAHLGVIGLAAGVYLFNLTVSGFANTYYSMAAQAASLDWAAWFFGSLDPANFITVDKPPLATMVMGLSVRLFGLSSGSILLPQALAGVATVALLYAIVRRQVGPGAATIAATVAALTPAAVVIFRYNNPDALLTLLLVGAAWAFFRGLDDGRLRWVVLAGVLIGLAFNTKFLQAYLVLPAFALTYFVAAPGNVRRRIGHLALAFAVVVLSSGWWVAGVELIPVADRPFIGGSTNNSALQLAAGYDGLQRIAGDVGPEGRFGGTPGLGRMFNSRFGAQVGWLLPVAFLGLVAGLVAHWLLPRTDSRRAAVIFWGTWLVVHVVVFSFMSGKVHAYVAVAMAPAIGALVGSGLVTLWTGAQLDGRNGRVARLVLAAAIAGSAVLAALLLGRTPGFFPWLVPIVLAAGLVGGLAVALPASTLQRVGPQALARRIALAGAVLGAVAVLAGPAAYAIETIRTPYSGTDPQAGPLINAPDAPALAVSDNVVAFLVGNRGSATWIVAVMAAREGERIQLATGAPVMVIGGFSGNDNALSTEQLQSLVANGEVRYFLMGAGETGGGDSSGVDDRGDPSSIAVWVTDHAAVALRDADGVTVYALSVVARS